MNIVDFDVELVIDNTIYVSIKSKYLFTKINPLATLSTLVVH